MFKRPACLSSKRITTRSPCEDGIVDTRTSTSRPAFAVKYDHPEEYVFLQYPVSPWL